MHTYEHTDIYSHTHIHTHTRALPGQECGRSGAGHSQGEREKGWLQVCATGQGLQEGSPLGSM